MPDRAVPGSARGAAPGVAPEAGPAAEGRERVAKAIARAGLASRREAEAWVAAGRVAVNGRVLDSPAVTVGPADRVTVDGTPLPAPAPPRLWRYHKPAGLVTTRRDPQGRPTVFERLPPELPRVVSVGRLDLNSEGLLLLTSHGGLARHLELPATGWLRRYRVRVHGTVAPGRLERLAEGAEVSGVRYGPIEARLDRVQGANAWLTMGLREGRNREIRRVLEHLGLTVTRLIRISYGPFQLGPLPRGAVEEVRTGALRDQLGPAWRTLAGPRAGGAPASGPDAGPGAASGPRRGGKAEGGKAGGGGGTGGDARRRRPA